MIIDRTVGNKSERERVVRLATSLAAAPWTAARKLASGTGFNVPNHHRAREDHGKQEKLEASSMEGSEGATMAWWRSCARYGGSACGGEANSRERERSWHEQIAYLS